MSANDVGFFPFEHNIQLAILQNMLKDEVFLYKCILNVKKEYFESKYLSWFFEYFIKHQRRYSTLPSYPVIKNEIMKFDPTEQPPYLKILDDITNSDFKDTEYLNNELTAFVKRAYFLNNIKDIAELYNGKQHEESYTLMKEVADGFVEIDFQKDDVFNYSDILSFVDSCKFSPHTCIPLGIRPIDEKLYGGLAKGDTCIFLGPGSAGKSMVLLNIARNAIEHNHNVLFLSLENKTQQTMLRFLSSMTMIQYDKFKAGSIDNNDKIQIMLAKEKMEKHLAVKHWYDPQLDILKVYGYCKERMKRHPYDMLVIDYMQMIKCKAANKNQWQEMEEVAMGIELLARDLNIPIVTAVQGTRDAQIKSNKHKGDKEDLLRMTDISLSFGISRKTDLLITMTVSDKDYKNGVMKLLLDKNRDGEKGVAVECQQNWSSCRIFGPELSCKVIEASDPEMESDKIRARVDAAMNGGIN